MNKPRERQAPERREAILTLLGKRSVKSQGELQSLLARKGFDVNQGTLSRDLRAMGVVKGPSGYALAAANGPPATDASAGVRQAALQWLTSVARAQNQVVLRTPAGGAQPLALAIDKADLADVLGTIGGDDTILIITPDARAAKRVAGFFESLKP